ncbi:MAG TPA: saccharopine dehydrogenase NADP-binding domain-containing protein [Actinomycetota bacterium]|nr:saccharopine dehydrogenase NADP-binding domain-containing protein [Actinomycetota bacterium]
MNVLLLGATGTIGRRAAAELARSDEVTRLVVAGRGAAETGRVARLLARPDGSVTGAAFDARDPAAVHRHADGCDVVASCAGPAYDVDAGALTGAARAGVPYASLGDYDSDAPDAPAGAAALTGCGLSPGLVEVMAVLAARALEHVERVDVAVARSIADARGRASALALLHAVDRDVDDGGGRTPALVYFPEPVGWVETVPARGPRGPVAGAPAAMRLGLTERVAMDALRASAAARLGRGERRRRAWLRVARAIGPAAAAVPPRGASWSAARVDVGGRAGGHRETVSLGVVDRLSNLAALPLVHATLALGSGRVAPAGVRAAHEALDLDELVAALGGRGVRIARLEPQPV